VHYALSPSHVTDANLWSLYCVGRDTGWAAGDRGTLLTTVNGGLTWTARTTGVGASLRAVAFADASVGLTVGDNATALRSVDGGVTWGAVSLPGLAATTALTATAIARDRSVAWIAGDGVIARSADGGKSFALVAGLPVNRWRALRFAADALHGVVVGDGGRVMLSSDGGLTWRAAATAPASLAGVSITPDGARIVAVGTTGLVWRSTDGGASFARVPTVTANLAAIGFQDDLPQQGWAVGASGTILRTSDGGASFVALSAPIAVDLTATEDFN
jgi:photosystem II stability/assembly factor-like uncharacterized protein